MIVAKVHISGAQAFAVDKKPITAGMAGAQVCMNYIDSVWNGLKKTVVFYGAVTRYVVTDAEVVTIPAAVLTKPNIQLVVGVYGEKAAGSLVIPTLRAELGMIRVGTMVSGNKEEYVLDTSDATAAAEDIADGKTAYVNGEKVTGTLPDGMFISSAQAADSVSFKKATCFGALEQYQLEYEVKPFSERRIVDEDCSLTIAAKASALGNAKASDVAKGKTFTSTAGLKVTGTHECASGLDTSDATAAAEDIADGKTAYANGEKVTGTLPDGMFISSAQAADSVSFKKATCFGALEQYQLEYKVKPFSERRIVDEDCSLTIAAKASALGNAKASDVAKGKTFTSTAGLKVTGTRAEPSISLKNNVLFIK